MSPPAPSALLLPLTASLGCLLCALMFIRPRAGSGTWSPSRCKEMGVGGSLVPPPGWTGWLRVLRQWAREGPGARPRAGKGRLKDKHRPAPGHELGLQRGWQTLPVAHGALGRRSGQSGGGQRLEVVSRESDSQWRAPGLLCSPHVLALPSCNRSTGHVIPALHMGILRQGGMCPRPYS